MSVTHFWIRQKLFWCEWSSRRAAGIEHKSNLHAMLRLSSAHTVLYLAQKQAKSINGLNKKLKPRFGISSKSILTQCFLLLPTRKSQSYSWTHLITKMSSVDLGRVHKSTCWPGLLCSPPSISWPVQSDEYTSCPAAVGRLHVPDWLEESFLRNETWVNPLTETFAPLFRLLYLLHKMAFGLRPVVKPPALASISALQPGQNL